MTFKITKSGSRSLVDVDDEASYALPEWSALEIIER